MKTTNILASDNLMLINDIHIASNKIDAFIKNMDEALQVCYENNVKYMLIGGDLFESRSSQSLLVLMTVKNVLKKITERGISIIMANGNHDKVAQEENEGYCHLYDTIPGVTVIDTYHLIQTPHANIFMLAYFPETGSLKEKIQEIESLPEFKNGKTNVLYAHSGVLESLGTKNKNEIDAKAFANFSSVYMGHYHNRNKFGKNIYYIGSSRQFNYGEDVEKGYSICNSYGELTFIQNKVNDRYVTISVKYADIHTIPDLIQKINDDHEGIKCNIRCIVQVTKASKDLVSVNKIQAMGIDKVIVESGEQKMEPKSSTLYEKLNTSQIKVSYREFCEEINEEPEIGLKYISKINL